MKFHHLTRNASLTAFYSEYSLHRGAFSSDCRLVLNAIKSAQGTMHMLLKPLANARVMIYVSARQFAQPLLGFNVIHAHGTLLTNVLVSSPLLLYASQSRLQTAKSPINSKWDKAPQHQHKITKITFGTPFWMAARSSASSAS